MILGFSGSGSLEGQERSDWVDAQRFGDADGWVLWADHPPQPDVPVEVKREGSDDISEVTPRAASLGWNIAGVWWRLPRGGK